MANKNKQIIEVVTKGAKKSEKEIKGVSGGLKKMAKSAGIAAVAYMGARGLTSAIQGSIQAFAQQELAEKKLEQVLKSTKNAVGMTAAELKKMASSLQSTTKFGDETIMGAQSLMLTFTKIGSEVMPNAIETVLNMSEAMGTDLKEQTIQLGKALNDPIAGIGALSRVGVQLTDEQKEMIKSFMDVGDTASAQQVILGELETQFGGLAEAAGDTLSGQLTKAQNAAGDASEAFGETLAPMTLKIASAMKSAAETFRDFFREANESDLETLIRETQELGGNTTELELALNKVNLSAAKTELSGELRDVSKIEDDILKKQEAKLEYNKFQIAHMLKFQELIAGEKQNRVDTLSGEKEALTIDELRNEVYSYRRKELKGIGVEQLKYMFEELKNQEKQLDAFDDEIDKLGIEKGITEDIVALQVKKGLLLEKQNASNNIEDTESTNTLNVDVNAPDEDLLPMSPLVFGPLEDEAFSSYEEAMANKIILDEKARQEQEEALRLQKKYLATYPEQAKLLGMVTKKETTLSKLRKESSYDAALQEINNATSQAKGNLINAIMKAVPFPFNLVAAAGASKLVDKMFTKLLKPITAQYGADFVTDGPQMILAGEGNGPEHVQITPLVDENRDGPQGGGQNITISGNVMTDEFVESHLVEKIREATRMGERI
tara:strand:+ start:1562 stop:3550 length:1989 start_codon:yes stop_codon:yes gene_type:complete